MNVLLQRFEKKIITWKKYYSTYMKRFVVIYLLMCGVFWVIVPLMSTVMWYNGIHIWSSHYYYHIWFRDFIIVKKKYYFDIGSELKFSIIH